MTLRRPTRVYFIHAPTSGLVKIGFTSDLRKRIQNLQHFSPEPLILLAHMPGSYGDEQALHARLWRHRRHGEWFEDGPAIRACVAEAKRHCQSVPPSYPKDSRRVKRALDEIKRLTLLGEADALDLLNEHRPIITLIGRHKMSMAGKLIHAA